MADKNKKYSENASGPYYVDDQCIACDACCMEAPKFFAMTVTGHAFVKKAPRNPAEVEECENALNTCPVDAIGRDG